MQKTTLTVTNEKGHKMTLVGTIATDGSVAIEYSVVDHTGEPMKGMGASDDPFALFRCVDRHMEALTSIATEAVQADHEAQSGGVTH